MDHVTHRRSFLHVYTNPNVPPIFSGNPVEHNSELPRLASSFRSLVSSLFGRQDVRTSTRVLRTPNIP